MRATIIGIGGCTNAGKSTLARRLRDELTTKHCSVQIIEQDMYYHTKENVKKVKSIKDPKIVFYDYDYVDALDVKKLINDTKINGKDYDFLIIEGSMITDIDELYELIDFTLFLTIDKDICIQRRNSRVYDPPDLPNYFEQIVWPSYNKTLEHATFLQTNVKANVSSLVFIGTTHISVTSQIEQIIRPELKNSMNLLRIQHDAINIEHAIKFANETNCGAISSFIGTTRDLFEEKVVTHLEYECYESMAYKELRKLCLKARQCFKTIERIVIIHRIGEVEVGEASIIIVASSPQRKDAIAATEYLINNVKSTIPIWKKEIYSDGTSSWKANKESILPTTK